MCLGESTTFAGGLKTSYPARLEEILNHRNLGIKFSVINKGAPAKDSTFILNHVGSYLDIYKPDMVIVMMGINDGLYYLKDISSSKPENPLCDFRVFRLYKLLHEHIVHKIYDATPGLPKLYPDFPAWSFLAAHNRSTETHHGKPHDDSKTGDFKALPARKHLPRLLSKTGMNPRFKKSQSYIDLGAPFYDRAQYIQAEALFEKAIVTDPENPEAYVQLASAFLWRHKFSQAEKLLNKLVALKPQDDSIFTRLGWLMYCTQGPKQAETALRRALEVQPENDLIFYTLGKIFYQEGEYLQAKTMYEVAIRFNPENDFAYGGLVAVHQALGNAGMEYEYYKKANEVRSGYYVPATRENYLKLKKILDDRGIKFVCVQYPVRNLTPLKKMFAGSENVMFVDNEKVFKEAIRKSSYREYFSDLFAGDFGHCTPKGYGLLAKNIASVVLNRVFGK